MKEILMALLEQIKNKNAEIHKTLTAPNSIAGYELGSLRPARGRPEEKSMRSLIVLGGLALALLASSTPGLAREYPWCAQYSWSNYNCGFVTFQQCLATIAGVGGYCKPNPRYGAPPPRRYKERRVY